MMKTWPWMARRIGVLSVLSLCAWSAHADDTDPPGRAARLSDTQGSVSLQPAGLQEWTSATLNRPLTTGDRLWSDVGSRAELDMGAAVVRLGATTGFSFLKLDDTAAQMQLTAGTLIVRVREMRGGENYEIDTPNIAVTLAQPGEYRVEVDETGDTTIVKVSEGLARAAGGGQQAEIAAQRRVSFTGAGQVMADGATLGAPDELDAWSAARERQIEDSPSREYIADNVAGTQDLDDSGQWRETPEYGYVWTPTGVIPGWAPYRYGHWAWVGPWGWTWIDDARWGYAPFHYGRWVSWNANWCWVPGPRVARPVYAPALVGWIGGPAGDPLIVGGADVGWFPLGPQEVYVPGYRVSPAYARNVNVTNTTIINNTSGTHNIYTNTNSHYVNNTAAGVTAVSQGVFASGERLAGHTQRLPPTVLAGAVAGAVAPAIVPNRASVLGAGVSHGLARPPPALMNRLVLALTPLPRAPIPFDRQVRAMQANGGRPLALADLARLQPPVAAVPVRMVSAAQPARPGSPAVPPTGMGTPGLADREHALQNSAATGAQHPSPAPPDLPANAPRPRTFAAPAAAPAVPAARYDRPAVAPIGPPPPPQTSQSAPVYGEVPQAAPARQVWSAPVASAPATAVPQYRVPTSPREAAPRAQAPPAPVATRPPASPQPAPSAPKPTMPQPQAHEAASNR